MAKRKTIEETTGEAAAKPESAPKPAEAKAELPVVESPSISPATEPAPAAAEPQSEPVTIAPVSEPAAEAPASEPAAPESVVDLQSERVARSRFALRPRHKRYALLAASVTIAAALGAVIGAVATGGFAKPPRTDVAGLEERKAMQQSIAHLSKELTTLKINVVAANKSAQTQIAKISERLSREAAEITGSISAPQTMPPQTAPTQAALTQVAAPLPPPRPATQIATIETPARAPIVTGWTIRDSRDGYVYVESHGEIYQVVPGAPLPGLGPVEQIKRQDGRWVVVTPKGLIVSMRDRRYFE